MIDIDQLVFAQNEFQLEIPRLTLHAGITLLVGRNGAGKSTFLQLLATALLPDQGEIRYGGRRITKDLPLIRSQIGFLPTGIELYDEMTPRRFLRYLVELKGVHDRGVVENLLKKFDLLKVEHRKIGKLPQGLRQRIALAQAWIGSPTYLFLDEPMNDLDTRERKHLVSLLNRYARNRCVVASTHDFQEWEDQADRILWIDRGKVRFHDSLEKWKECASTGERLSLEEAFLRRLMGDRSGSYPAEGSPLFWL
ncbi:MAG: ABC transporter ATP-binding protein [Thermicanus sp.]|nr:ABC transporter ATP-binding protein [Thermicanus sp.]